MGCQYFDYLSVSLKCFNVNFLIIHKLLILICLYVSFVLNASYDFKYDLINICMLYLVYSPARPLCLIFYILVPYVAGPSR